MAAPITSGQVWREIEKQIFAVLGFVSPQGKARTAGIVYCIRNRQLFIATQRRSWKERHIERNPAVSLTVTLARRVPLIPWIKVPPATITFQGDATVHDASEVSAEILRVLLRGLETDRMTREKIRIIRVCPKGDFLTYGVGVSLLAMRKPEKARGRAPVH